MGQFCSTSVNEVAEGEGAARSSSKKDLSAAAPDKEPTTTEDTLASFRERFRGTVYYSALMESSPNLLEQLDDDSSEKGADGRPGLAPLPEQEEDEESFRYAPAANANRHRRATVVIDDATTLLKTVDKKATGSKASVVVLQELKEPSSRLVRHVAEGYPGELTAPEVETCVNFRKRAKGMPDPAYYDMILGLKPAEEEPYGICRFLRARNFDIDATFEMMEGAVETWNYGAKHDFFPTIEQAIGCSEAIFYSQYPLLHCGLAKNGTVVALLRAGTMSTEAMECVVNLDSLKNVAWFMFKNKLVDYFGSIQDSNPEAVVRCELTYVIDLIGLTPSQVSTKAIDALKSMFSCSMCFPEVLNKLVVVNAPSFFSFVWRMIKVFLHPRTARKVEIYSATAKGNHRLQEIIDIENIPSDYGGKAPSFDYLHSRKCCPEGSRQVHQLLYARKQGKTDDWTFKLEETEQASITVYTRSPLEADVTVSVKDTEQAAKACVKNSGGEEEPYSKEIAAKLQGPGDVLVAATSKAHHASYFLVVASISPK